MAASRKYDKRALQSLIKRVAAMDGVEVSVGFFPEDKYGPDNDNLPVAQVAWYNERGLGMVVPPRPFMETSFNRDEQRFYFAGMKAVWLDVLQQGRQTKAKLRALGDHAVGIVKMTIDGWTTPANSDRWAAIKGKNDPLVFTGKMLDSVTYKVERNDA